eukprot:c38780_g1_i1.p1 GENE.c38780_g1_i1~~c38780_g1_i1.p1  ORF type:complete len:582 (-),score=108.59 c38780_g1_i1:273-2018(-)
MGEVFHMDFNFFSDDQLGLGCDNVELDLANIDELCSLTSPSQGTHSTHSPISNEEHFEPAAFAAPSTTYFASNPTHFVPSVHETVLPWSHVTPETKQRMFHPVTPSPIQTFIPTTNPVPSPASLTKSTPHSIHIPVIQPQLVPIVPSTPISSPPLSHLSSPCESMGTGKRKKRDRVGDVPDTELNPDQLAKRMRRRELNKVAAQNSRQRKMQRITTLEQEVQRLAEQNSGLQTTVNSVIAENELLRASLQAHGLSLPLPSKRSLQRAGSALLSLALLAMIVYNPTHDQEAALAVSVPPSAAEPTTRSLKMFIDATPASASDVKLEQFEEEPAIVPTKPEAFAKPSYENVHEKEMNETEMNEANEEAKVPRPSTSSALVPAIAEKAARALLEALPSNLSEQDAQSVVSVLQLILPTAQFEHRYGEQDVSKALEHVKQNGQPNTQYIICPTAHAITLTASPSQPRPSTVLPSERLCDKKVNQKQEEDIVMDVKTEPVDTESNSTFSTKEDTAPRVAILLPPGIVTGAPGLCHRSVGGGSRLDEVVCSSGTLTQYGTDDTTVIGPTTTHVQFRSLPATPRLLAA